MTAPTEQPPDRTHVEPADAFNYDLFIDTFVAPFTFTRAQGSTKTRVSWIGDG